MAQILLIALLVRSIAASKDACTAKGRKQQNANCMLQQSTDRTKQVPLGPDTQGLPQTLGPDTHGLPQQGNNCSGGKEYKEGTAYEVGELVSNVGSTFNCTNSDGCSCEFDGACAPGLGVQWRDAWIEVCAGGNIG